MTVLRRIRGILPSRPGQRRVRVVTDSTADLPPDLARELEIPVIPLQVIFGTQLFRDNGTDLTTEEFFRRLAESPELPRTSQPSVGEFTALYQEVAKDTDRILSIHLSSRFSGTVDTARLAARELIGRASIEVIDSSTVSMALGLAVIAAARAARDGGDLDACAEAARSVLRRQRLAVVLDTLEFLRRGGRIGRAQAFLGGLLRLKPILTIRDGEAFPLTRVRTRKRALHEALDICLGAGEVEEAVVMHATTPDDAERMAEEIRRRCPTAHVHLGRMGPVIGVHGGPGILGIAVQLAEEPSSEDARP